MPRSILPSISGSSTSQDNARQLSGTRDSLKLPPLSTSTAWSTSTDLDMLTSPSEAAPNQPPVTLPSAQSEYPLQAAETVKSRRRSSATKDNSSFALPPPPTRSRKIIQMKPGSRKEKTEEMTAAKPSGKAGKGAAKTAGSGNGSSTAGTAAQGKKKQPSARVLLAASIDYVRYLEDCVSQLKAQSIESKSHCQCQQSPHISQPLPSIRDFHPTFVANPSTADVDMSDSDSASPLLTGRPQHQPHSSSISPDLPPDEPRHRQQSFSSASTDQRHYSFSLSTSPAFGPQEPRSGGMYMHHSSSSISSLTSPALQPQSDLDQEATAALLMLNSDRRGLNPDLHARGLSVCDLLSA